MLTTFYVAKATERGIIMPVMDEFKEQRDAMKNKPLKERLDHFWYYHKWYLIGGIVAIVFVIILINSILTDKETTFCAVITDVDVHGDEQQLIDNFTEYSRIDTDTYDVAFDSAIYFINGNYQSPTKITAMLSNESIDVLSFATEYFEKYAYNGTFLDLRTCMTEEQLAAYESRTFYIDKHLADENEEHNMEEDYEYQYATDPLNPDSMVSPVPVGILISDSDTLQDVYSFVDTSYIGIPSNAKNVENAVTFIEYIQ